MSDTPEMAMWKSKHGIGDAPPDILQVELRMKADDQASNATSWCWLCDVQMPVREMHIITRRMDPYIQIDEGPGEYIAKSNRVRACPDCFKGMRE